jgi:hypothetical protein
VVAENQSTSLVETWFLIQRVMMSMKTSAQNEVLVIEYQARVTVDT